MEFDTAKVDPKVKVVIVFHTTGGRTLQLAQAAAEGFTTAGAEVLLRRVPETLSDEDLKKNWGVFDIQVYKDRLKDIEVIKKEELIEADAILFGSPIITSLLSPQVNEYINSLGGLWFENKVQGKPVALFGTSSAQHGGAETMFLSFISTILCHGMIFIGFPPSFKLQQTKYDEPQGVSSFGVVSATGWAERDPPLFDKEALKFHAGYLAEKAAIIKAGTKIVEKKHATAIAS